MWEAVKIDDRWKIIDTETGRSITTNIAEEWAVHIVELHNVWAVGMPTQMVIDTLVLSDDVAASVLADEPATGETDVKTRKPRGKAKEQGEVVDSGAGRDGEDADWSDTQ